MAAKQEMKEKLQCTSKYGHLRISQDICHVRITDFEGFLTIYGHSDNLLNNKYIYIAGFEKVAPRDLPVYTATTPKARVYDPRTALKPHERERRRKGRRKKGLLGLIIFILPTLQILPTVTDLPI